MTRKIDKESEINEFLDKFQAGKYYTLTLLIHDTDIVTVVTALENSDVEIAIIPQEWAGLPTNTSNEELN